MMNALLCSYGYEPVVTASVTDAIEQIRSGGLDLCILDHWITALNGIELCKQIRTFNSSLPILFYSGAGYEAEVQNALAAGAQAYLVKPNFDLLMPTIDQLIDDLGSEPSLTM